MSDSYDGMGGGFPGSGRGEQIVYRRKRRRSDGPTESRVPGVLPADVGSFVFGGSPVGLLVERVVSAGGGSFLFSGDPATLILTSSSKTLSADIGTFLFGGDPMTPVVDHVLPAGGGTFSISGTDVTLTKSSPLTLALDGGTGATKTANASLADVPLPAFSTSGTNRIVIIAQTGNGGTFAVPTGGGLTFTLIPGETPVTGGSSECAVYWAFAPTQLTNVVFTIHQGSAAYFTGLVFAVEGGKTSGNPFDINSPGMDSTGVNALVTTSALNTFCFGVGINPGSSAINSFVEMNSVASGTYVTLNYRIVTGATLSGINWDSTAMAGSITAALVQGP